MPTPDDVTDQYALLAAHRATLTILLRQKALAGSVHVLPAVEHDIHHARNEIRRIKTLLIAWGEDVPDAPDDEAPAYPLSEPQQKLKLTVHLAVFTYNELLCYFINATNLSDREVEITHVWFECPSGQVPALQQDRPLPKRVKPDETWETLVEARNLPNLPEAELVCLGRVRLSTWQIVKAKPNIDVDRKSVV